MKAKWITFLAAAAAATALSACQDYQLQNQEAAIVVEPEELDFGYVTTGTTTAQTFRIKNVGDSTATIERFTWAAEVDYFSIDRDEGASFDLASGATVEVQVTFDPQVDLPADTNTIFVHHNAADDAAEVRLVFEAGVAPDLVADPNPVNFGPVNNNDTHNQQVTLTNVGSGRIDIDDVTFQGDPEFTLDAGDAIGASLASGDSTALQISVSPAGQTGAFSGEIHVESNDPDENPLIIPVTASSGVPYAYCSADPPTVLAIHESSTYLPEDEQGNQSGDATYGFNELAFYWSFISTPSGSSVVMPGTIESTRTITPDVVGTYEAQLVVCNPLEQCSDPCVTSFEAIMQEDLWVEMYWTQANDDMDLHLLNDGGSFNSNGDCYYANCVGYGPDWGQSGYSGDDPSLDLDDIPGTGPENINIVDPADGTYTVVVHDYTGSTPDYQGANNVTVNVYTFGQLEFSDTRPISGEGHQEQFCACTFPSGVCTPL